MVAILLSLLDVAGGFMTISAKIASRILLSRKYVIRIPRRVVMFVGCATFSENVMFKSTDLWRC